MATIRFREAINAAIREEMRRDPRVLIMGEDVGFVGGTYKATENLYAEFGERRVKDTPICENTFIGAAIGAAMGGLRPVVEIMSINFVLLAFDQLMNNAAKLHYMFGGQVHLPMVIRSPGGGSRQLGSQHSQALDSYFFHMPGLKICCPSNPEHAKGLLTTAIRDEDVVVFLEHEAIYGMTGEVPDHPYVVPMGKAKLVHEGDQVTVISWSNMVNRVRTAVDKIQQEEGISCDLLDLRTLNPLNMEAIIQSVRKTGRALVVEEGWLTGGVNAEIAARIGESAFDFLDRPVLRLGAVETPTPYAKQLEAEHTPNLEKIMEAIRTVAGR